MKKYFNSDVIFNFIFDLPFYPCFKTFGGSILSKYFTVKYINSNI